MKCCIIRDLLPSYIDGLTCEETNEEIRAHLEHCTDCHTVYQQMTAMLPAEIPEEETDIDFFRKLKTGMYKRYLVIACVTCLVVVGLGIAARSYRIPLPYDPERMVTKTYQAVLVLNRYGLPQWQDLRTQDLETAQAVLDGTREAINLIQMTITEPIGNDDAVSMGRTIDRNGTNVRVVYYCYTKTLWNSLLGGRHAFADSYTTTGAIYGGRLMHKEYQPLMTEIYYLPKGNMNSLTWLSDEAFDELRAEGDLVWSGIN